MGFESASLFGTRENFELIIQLLNDRNLDGSSEENTHYHIQEH